MLTERLQLFPRVNIFSLLRPIYLTRGSLLYTTVLAVNIP